MPSAIASGLSGSTRTAASPAASSSEAMRGGDDGRPARHRLEDRDSEAFEEGRVREDGGAAVEIGQFLVGDVLGRNEPQLRGASSIAAARFAWFFRGSSGASMST